MQIKKLPKSQVEFIVIVPAKEFETFLNLAAKDLSREVKIDGFRPGKAPRNIVEQKIGSEKIMAHGAEKAIKKSYADFIAENKIEAIGEPKITITKIAPKNDLEYKAVVDVMPKVVLGNHRKEAKKIRKNKPDEISSDKVDGEIENLARMRAKLVTVNRPAEKGDRVEIDFEVRTGGKVIDGGVSKNHPLTIGESYFIPGFEENLIGMKEGELKSFDLEFPSDYHQKELSGKPASFSVNMNLVQKKEIPEINADFAKSLGGFENLAKLKESVREGMEAEQKKRSQEKWQIQVIEEIAKSSQMDVPDTLVRLELDKMMAEFEQNISQMGMTLDSYLSNIKKTRDDLEKDWHEAAGKRAKAALIMKEIARVEDVRVDSKDIENEMNKILSYYKNIPDMEKKIDMKGLYEYTKGMLTNEKVFQILEKS